MCRYKILVRPNIESQSNLHLILQLEMLYPELSVWLWGGLSWNYSQRRREMSSHVICRF